MKKTIKTQADVLQGFSEKKFKGKVIEVYEDSRKMAVKLSDGKVILVTYVAGENSIDQEGWAQFYRAFSGWLWGFTPYKKDLK